MQGLFALKNLAASGKYGEYGISYDKNGNIKTLKRRFENTANDVDNLAYTYTTGNQLSAVVDNATASYKGLLFVDGNTGGADYSYDANGNMKTDLNKGITTAIVYNYLNLPQTVSTPSATINYTYDATGQKLEKVAGSSTTEYIGGIHYENNSLTFIQTAEGRITKSGSVWTYEYNLKDHLGNVRVSFDKHPTTGVARLIQKDDYYPFGLTFNSYSNSPENLYKFQGQEEQKETGWVQFKWRNHDPTIGRFFNVDPLAEDYVHNSPYAFSENKVTAHIELEGLEAVPAPRPGYRARSGGNISNIRRTVEDASRIAKRPTGFATLGRREGTMFTRKTTYTSSRGDGLNNSGMFPRSASGESDEKHTSGNTAGSFAKVLIDIKGYAQTLADNASKVEVTESFTESGSATVSLGMDVVVDDSGTTMKLGELQSQYTSAVMGIARGNLSPEEFSQLDPSKQNTLILGAQLSAGPSPLQIILQKVLDMQKVDTVQSSVSTLSSSN